MESSFLPNYSDWRHEYDTIEDGLDSLGQSFDDLNRPFNRRDGEYDLGQRIDAINDQRPLIKDILASDDLAPQGLALLERMVTEEPSRFDARDLENLHFRGYQIISVNDERIMELAKSEDAEVAASALRLIYAAGEKMYRDEQGAFMTDNLTRLAWNAIINPYHKLHDPKYAAESLISCVRSEDGSVVRAAIRAAHGVMHAMETSGFGSTVYEGLVEHAFKNDKVFGARQEIIDLYKTRPELLDYKTTLENYLRCLNFGGAKTTSTFEIMDDVDAFYAQAKNDPDMMEAFQRSVGAYIASPKYAAESPVLYSSWTIHMTGSNYGNYLRAWDGGCGGKMRTEEYENRNIEAMAAIELIEPGAVKALTEEFGIYNFMRYPTRTMVNQYRNKDNKDLEYGVYIMPRTDHNGAFHPSNSHLHLIDSFERSLEQVDAGMRIYEAHSIMGAARAVMTARHKYEKQLHFAVIGGHGTPNTLELNSADLFEGYILRMHIRRIRDRPADRMMNIFTNDATIILDSCSTGKIDGLAEELNDFLSAEAYAPRTPTKLESIDILSGDQPSSFVLIPLYRDQGTMAHYPRPQRPELFDGDV